MKTSALRWLFCLGLGWGVLASMAWAQTAVVTPVETRCSANGGTMTFHVALDYAGKALRGVGLEVSLPAGWAYQTTFGVDQPEVTPQAGETGAVGWAFVTVPAEGAKFAFVLSYPAGLTEAQVLVVRPIFRPAPEGAVVAQKIVVAAP
jgi:hypothetical protein